MSPVGRPEELQDGKPMRSFRGGRNLGELSEWDCPGCGKKNTGNKPELGCVHCGAGTPGQAGAQQKALSKPEAVRPARASIPDAVGESQAAPQPARVAPSAELRVYRLIEYVFSSPAHMAATLQRSLVGQVNVGGSLITATIVDDVSPRQKDLLTLASRQPGVWVANPEAMGGEVAKTLTRRPQPAPEPRPHFITGLQVVPEVSTDLFQEAARRREMANDPETQDPALTPTQVEKEIAGALLTLIGYKGASTFVFALQMFAEQVEASPLNTGAHYTREECLRLAAALNELIPADYGQGGEAEIPPAAPDGGKTE